MGMLCFWKKRPSSAPAEAVRREASDYLILANLSDASSPTTQLVLNAIGEENARRAKRILLIILPLYAINMQKGS